MNKVLDHVSNKMEQENIQIHYLDACFPFWTGFPLIPHLSHNDGKKIDLSFIYLSADGKISNRQKSVLGYGVFVEPTKQEINQTAICKNQGFWHYDISKYITLGTIHKDLSFSEKDTKKLIDAIVLQKEVKKVFIEPHLKQRLNLNNDKIRFHGCHAVRHDDHIHIEVE